MAKLLHCNRTHDRKIANRIHARAIRAVDRARTARSRTTRLRAMHAAWAAIVAIAHGKYGPKKCANAEAALKRANKHLPRR